MAKKSGKQNDHGQRHIHNTYDRHIKIDQKKLI